MSAIRTSTGAAELDDQHLAAVHLRLGALLLARAELESLAIQDRLGPAGLAHLAEARWRTNELGPAAEAAAAHLAAAGTEPIARVILAEAAAAGGRSEESRAHVAALRALTAEALAALFAGMPQRAVWPSTLGGVLDAAAALVPEEVPAVRDRRPVRLPRTTRQLARAHGGGPDRPLFPDAQDLLGQARDEIRGGDPARIASALDRLALTLRLDPTLASEIAEIVSRLQEPAAMLLRGDTLRILGRILEAEAAYGAAAAALDRAAKSSR